MRLAPRLRGRASAALAAGVAAAAATAGSLAGWSGVRGTVHVAVAANFAEPHEYLVEAFEAGTGHSVVTSIGATGQLYSQIRNGAPFDVFLAADDARPDRLEQEQLASPGSRFTYAIGRLVLYGPDIDSVRAYGTDLRDPRHRRIAIANPGLAPYGRAARQTLERLGYYRDVAARLVQGENVAQTYQFVHTGAAELGFVAFSQVRSVPPERYWLVPAEYHDPIAQDAVLLRHGATNPAALAYVEFLRGDVARRIIEAFGYGVTP